MNDGGADDAAPVATMTSLPASHDVENLPPAEHEAGGEDEDEDVSSRKRSAMDTCLQVPRKYPKRTATTTTTITDDGDDDMT